MATTGGGRGSMATTGGGRGSMATTGGGTMATTGSTDDMLHQIIEEIR